MSDIRKFEQATGWYPHVKVQHGVKHLCHWLSQMHKPFVVPVQQRKREVAR